MPVLVSLLIAASGSVGFICGCFFADREATRRGASDLLDLRAKHYDECMSCPTSVENIFRVP